MILDFSGYTHVLLHKTPLGTMKAVDILRIFASMLLPSVQASGQGDTTSHMVRN